VRTRLTPIELALAFAVGGSALAAMVPSCVRSIRVARTAEATENVETIFTAALNARNAGVPLTSTGLTPPNVPRGTTVVDPPGTWDHPTWKALGIAYEDPHWYAYRVEIDPEPGTALRVVALGDLDGDGVTSWYERSATMSSNGQLVPRPGLVIESELE
jgi:hypothetical protein